MKSATHQGTCQLCGRLQMLPNGGLLAKHGYDVQWGFFNGVCPGADHKPYELSKDLIESYLPTARKRLVEMRKEPAAIRAAAPKTDGVFYSVPINFKSVGLFGKLVKHESESKYEKGTDFVATHRGEEVRRYLSSKSVAEVAVEFREKAAKLAEFHAEQYAKWVQYLEQRKADWKLAPENLIPVTPESRVTLHAINEYYSKKTGQPQALCGSGSRFSGRYTYKQTTTDQAKVTCKACLKALAATKADEAEYAQAMALVNEMIAKHGERTRESYTDANRAAQNEIRFKRKDIDKAIRSRACRILDNGVKS